MTQTSSSKVLWVVDDQAPKANLSTLSKLLAFIQRRMPLTIVKLSQTSENDLLDRLDKNPADLVIVPNQQYFEWNTLELMLQNNSGGAHSGRNRGRGSVFAGTLNYSDGGSSLKAQGAARFEGTRRVLIDSLGLSPFEILLLLQSMAQDTRKSGIQAMLLQGTLIYCENWYRGQGAGLRIESLLKLPEVNLEPWETRGAAIRILLGALWSLIYEEGPGQALSITQQMAERARNNGSATPIAYFQCGADSNCLAMRLGYHPNSKGSPSEVLTQFTTHSTNPTAAAQLLIKYSDFIRVHAIPENGNIEILVCLFPSAPSHDKLRNPPSAPEFGVNSAWIEPISEALIQEKFFEMPSPSTPRLRAIPAMTLVLASTAAQMGHGEPGSKPEPRKPSPEKSADPDKIPKRLYLAATSQVRDLQSKLKEQQEKVREMRAGGIGMSAPLPMPDAEDLLRAFQERYFDARFQIREFEHEIARLEKQGAQPFEIEKLKLKMEALENRERSWIRKLMATLQNYRTAMKESK